MHSITPRGKVVQNEEIYHMIWSQIMCLCEYINNSIWGLFIQKYFVFEAFLTVGATFAPISMKLCLLAKSRLTHVFTNFCNVSSFCFGFIGFWVYVAMPPF